MADADPKTILIVEDSMTQLLHLQQMLEEHGLRVVGTEMGLKGVDMAQELQPDLVILDLRLPDVDGLQVAERLKGNPDTAPIPIILMTQYGDTEVMEKGLQMGIHEYIPKDAFADAVLVETLRQMELITTPTE